MTYRRVLRSQRLLLAAAVVTGIACAADLHEPLTYRSEDGVLDILMVAKAAPVETLPSSPVGWVYEICKRPLDGSDACPVRAGNPNYYGGSLLQLQKGDTLKIHLVNELPPVTDSKHAAEPGREFLELNPTNIHTHGMLVAPRKATASDPTWGDSIFVLTFNPLNGKPAMTPHMHSEIRYGFTDYKIKIPESHPSGLFWFHPHAHGISLNQVTAGLGGIITVGNIADYVCKDRSCSNFVSRVTTRHMIIKDTQLLPNGKLQTQEDPDFCSPLRAASDRRQGSCDGAKSSDPDGSDYTGGKWLVTLNGQQYPTVRVKAPGGEIWRITNESASATYDLRLWNAAQKQRMLFQVLSLDGVSVSPSSELSTAQKTEASGGKFAAEICPDDRGDVVSREGLCTRRLFMMPSARAEIWVAYRDARGRFASPPPGATAVFRTSGYQTGPSGDNWPAVNLAHVEFSGVVPGGMPSVLQVNGEAVAMRAPDSLAANMVAANKAVGPDQTCHALPPGHMRRIFYGVPTDNPDGFGLAYEEVDEHGQVVGPAARDLTPFDPMSPTVCVPLAPENKPVTERW